MDFSELAFEASKRTISSFGKESNLPVVEDERLNDFIKQDRILMDYTRNLLELYHEELSKALAEQGIKI